MAIRFRVTNTYVVNGKEYGSVEEMPPEIREACEAADRSSAVNGSGGPFETVRGSIVFNGNEYPGEEAMPQEERELYRAVMKAVAKEGILRPGGPENSPGCSRAEVPISGAPIVPASAFSLGKRIFFAAAVLFLSGAAYLLFLSGR